MTDPSDGDGPRVSPLRIGDELVVISVPILDARRLDDLTEAERRVVTLALRGMSNHDIAGETGTSSRTVANHLASVFRKLGVISRAELAARMLGSGGD